jgi:hypothetical protein
MSVKYTSLFILLQFFFGHIHAQQSDADSLWCDHLNEFIKCASTDQVTDKVSPAFKDSTGTFITIPAISITGFGSGECVSRMYGQVSYVGYFYSSKRIDNKLLDQFESIHNKLKACLSLWDIARLKNSAPSLHAPEDYFITNGEDETTLRLDICKDPEDGLFYVRLRIY